MMPDDLRARLLAALKPGWSRSTAEVSAATGLSPPVVTKALLKLADQGVVTRTARGRYTLPDA